MTQIFQTGELVAQRFEIVRLIAAGGMGQVYEARDRTLGGQVALKLLNYPNLDNPEVNRRFRREIQLARQVTHPNVCRLYDVYQHRVSRGLRAELEVTLVTMELLEGETLENFLTLHGRMSEGAALPLVRQIAAALDAAHGAGVIHRDLKPSNVIMVPRAVAAREDCAYRAVVTDFGLARSLSEGSGSGRTNTPLTGEMKVVGTADYMAPEQIAGKPVGPASDVYAFGVVIFEMVTGRRPYSADNPLMLLTRRVTEPPSSPLEHHPGLDRRWAEVILSCLADDAADRPGSAAEVVERLEGRRPSAAAPPPPRRHRGSLALAALALVLAAGLVVLLALRRNPREASYSQAVQLTTSAGLEIYPSFSPDGRRLAFSSDESGTFEIYVRDLGPGGTKHQLTTDGGGNFEPVFSPDARHVVYHSVVHGGLWQVPAGGGTPRRLTEAGSRPAFSPDGRWLVMQTESSPQISDNIPPAPESSTLQVLDLESGELHALTHHGTPSGGHGAAVFSPDGRRVVFTASQRGSSEIWSVELRAPLEASGQVQGADPRLLVEAPHTVYDPVFGPGGRRLYFSGVARQVFALWVQELDRGGRPEGPPRQVENLGLASLRLAALSPDGARMAYTAIFTRSNLWSLALDSPDGPRGHARPLTDGSRRNTRPSFSPDGSRIAWESWTRGSNVDVWLMDAGGGNASQLTLHPAKDSQPRWSADGDRISFLRLADVGYRLISIDVSDRHEHEIAVLPQDADWAQLAPDGTRVAFHSRSGGGTLHLRLLDLAAGQSRPLARAAELMGFPCWSPDGASVVFQARRQGFNQIMVAKVDSGGEPRLLTGADADHYPYSFSPDGGRVAFVADRGGWNVWWIDTENGEERQLTDLDSLNGYVRYPAWSPAGDQVVFELAESTGDVWVAERTESQLLVP